MAVDSYVETLGQMVQLLREYKPGTVTLENITKLCQTLGLESFVDDINNKLARLSTASKIIVIDIDFDKIQNRVKDVKLVLASNFDYFNYFIDDFDSSKGETNNILLNSLTLYDDLKKFHSNLQFLYLLDTYSQVDIDNATSNTANTTGSLSTTSTTLGMTHTSSMGYNSIDNAMANGINISDSAISSSHKNINANSNNNNNNHSGKLDLFKYFTELTQYTIKYFKENDIKLNVVANLNNKIGIYITNPKQPSSEDANTGFEIVARITLEKSKNPQHRLFEYIYSPTTKNWINESPDSNILGVSLILELLNTDICFPESFITNEMVFEHSKENLKDKTKYNSQVLDNVVINTENDNEDLLLLNDFSSKLINVTKIDISNDALDLLSDLLKWMEWYTVVLTPLLEILDKNTKAKQSGDDKRTSHHRHLASHHHHQHNTRLSSITMGSNGLQPTALRHRRSSSKNKKPNLTEATMLKDEGLQQFNLHEIISQPVTEQSDLPLALYPNNEEALIIDGEDSNDKMDIDDNTISTTTIPENKEKQFIISEDHIELDSDLHCDLYGTRNDWDIFMKDIRNYVK